MIYILVGLFLLVFIIIPAILTYSPIAFYHPSFVGTELLYIATVFTLNFIVYIYVKYLYKK